MTSPLSRLDRRLNRLTWLVMVAGVGIDAVIAGFSNEPDRLAVSLFCVVFFAVLMLRLVIALRTRPRGRLAVVALLVGVLLWATESTVLQTAQNSGQGEHLASGEWAYLITYLVFVVFLLLDAEYRPATALTTWLETAVICAGSASLAGTLVVTPLAAGKPDAVPLFVALVYPVADVVLALLVLAQIGLRMRAFDRRSARLVLGFLLLAAADTSFVGNVLHGSSGSTVVAIVLWGAGFAQLVSAAGQRAPETALARANELPGTVLIGATVAAIAVLVIRPGERLGGYLVAAAVATLLAAGARMLLALREARRSAEELVLARTDVLTRLPNRHGTLRELDERLRAGGPLALLMMDLNGFKDLNDALGHSTGDLLLQACARRLREAGPGEVWVARMGGDEFALVVPEADEIALLELANTVLAAVRRPMRAGDIEVVMDAAIGIALRESRDRDAAALVRRADVALYQAKEVGADALVYEAARDDFSRERLRTVEELRRAIPNGELVLWYQPQIDAATRQVCGVEALVRWAHPKRGILPPVAFLPLARQAGLMPAVSEAVIRRAAADRLAWAGAAPRFPVSLNCPPPELLSGVFGRQLLDVVRETGLRATDFLVEVTEDSFLNDPERARDIVHQLRDEGLPVSIDDYGTGFSSLSYLRDLPVDELKIDRSFVTGTVTDPRTAMIVESTIRMAHALDLRVVAEGVEDAATAAALIALGADVLQGYHVARPMPADRLAEWVDEWEAGLAELSV